MALQAKKIAKILPKYQFYEDFCQVLDLKKTWMCKSVG